MNRVLSVWRASAPSLSFAHLAVRADSREHHEEPTEGFRVLLVRLSSGAYDALGSEKPNHRLSMRSIRRSVARSQELLHATMWADLQAIDQPTAKLNPDHLTGTR